MLLYLPDPNQKSPGPYQSFNKLDINFKNLKLGDVQEAFHNTLKVDNPVYWIAGVIELDCSATTPNMISGLNLCNLGRVAVIECVIVKASPTEGFGTRINTTKDQILGKNIRSMTIQLTASSVALNTLLHAFDKWTR